jgi:hypothetical protein
MNLSRVFNAISEDPDTGWFGHLTNGMRADWYIVVLPGHDARVRCKLCSSEQTPGFAFAGHLEGGGQQPCWTRASLVPVTASIS